ncbi:MAG: sulfurtransferase [Pseudomonadota bacterium]
MPIMHYDTLITVAQVQSFTGPSVIVDCRFSLEQPDLGARLFSQRHIQGAHFLDLNKDLSGSLTASSGRHPLPPPEKLADSLRKLGLNSDSQLIAYDDRSSAFAARLWWLCRWLGHTKAAVLDGGLAAWLAVEGATASGMRATPEKQGDFTAHVDNSLAASAQDVQQRLQQGDITLIDARGSERFSGKTEPLDAIAGHVPGAINLPFAANLQADGRFKSRKELKARFSGGQNTIHMCGSGVTACHNILASAYAGLEMPTLYPGSWSEWIRDPDRPVTQDLS